MTATTTPRRLSARTVQTLSALGLAFALPAAASAADRQAPAADADRAVFSVASDNCVAPDAPRSKSLGLDIISLGVAADLRCGSTGAPLVMRWDRQPGHSYEVQTWRRTGGEWELRSYADAAFDAEAVQFDGAAGLYAVALVARNEAGLGAPESVVLVDHLPGPAQRMADPAAETESLLRIAELERTRDELLDGMYFLQVERIELRAEAQAAQDELNELRERTEQLQRENRALVAGSDGLQPERVKEVARRSEARPRLDRAAEEHAGTASVGEAGASPTSPAGALSVAPRVRAVGSGN